MCGQTELEVSEVEVENPTIEVEVPSDVNLDTSRVGQEVSSFDDVVVGETVRFDYSGGSEYGTRNVLVLRVDDGALEGITLERDGGYRRYLNHYVDSNIFIVKPFVKVPAEVNGHVKRIRFDEAGAGLLASLTGDQLASLYAQYVAVEGDGAEFDPQTGEVVVRLPEAKTKFLTVSNLPEQPILVVRPDGKQFKLYLYENDDYPIGIVNDVTGLNSTEVTPEILRDELVKFLA
jgi:hypothetical protein